eukprot:1161379-Pelagomonas_calceolata.AAC.2
MLCKVKTEQAGCLGDVTAFEGAAGGGSGRGRSGLRVGVYVCVCVRVRVRVCVCARARMPARNSTAQHQLIWKA